jgi:hypothetical protein
VKSAFSLSETGLGINKLRGGGWVNVKVLLLLLLLLLLQNYMCVKYTVPNISRGFDSYMFDKDNLNLKWNATIHNFKPLQMTFTQATYERCVSVRKHGYSFGLNLTFRGPCIMIYSYNKS